VSFDGKQTRVKTGDVGMSPGTSVSGSYVQGDGSTEINSTPANKCANDRTITYNALKAKDCGAIKNELGGQTLNAGVYCDAGAPMTVSSDLTLDGPGNYIFQASSSFLQTLDTKIVLINGAKAENVFFAVSSSATIGADSTFVGTMIAYASINVETNAEINGQALAGAAVSFQSSNLVENPRHV
jgi:hypothetical protein